ncbi:unnamed protein product [Arctogadus glacialis]
MMLDIHKVNGIACRQPALTLIPDQAISTFVRLLAPDALPSATRPGRTPGSVGSESISSRSVWGDTLLTVERGLVTAAK